MSRITWLGAAMALACHAGAHAQSASEDETPQLVADCNGMAASAAKKKNARACEALASQGRLSLVEQAAVIAYWQYRDERRQECLRREASPRGQSRGQSCEP
jgi:hypothetical protein